MATQLEVKHSILATIGFLGLGVIPILILLRKDWQHFDFSHAVQVFASAYFLILFVRSILRAYIRVDNGVVQVLRSNLTSKKIPLNGIMDVEISHSPLSMSYFQLRSGHKIPFNSFSARNSDLEALRKLVLENGRHAYQQVQTAG